MLRSLRDLAAFVLALSVLVASSMMLSPRLRHGVVGSIRGDASASDMPPASTIGNAAVGAFDTVKAFSSENALLFAFIVVASVLFVMMLRT